MCLLLDYGLRVSEVAALTWAHVDLTDQTLTILCIPTAVQQLLTNTWVALENYRHDYPKSVSAPNAPSF